MTEFFLNIVNMSISASWLVFAVLLLRLLLKKAPKWINVLLWGVVAVRLICPFSFESVLSLIPSPQTINPEIALNSPVIDSGVTIIDNVINPIISEATISIQPEKDINLFQFIMPYLAGVWFVGIAALLIYTLISFLRLKSKIGTAVLLRDNIYQSEAVVSPFVLGIIKPKIYLPFNMNGQDMNHVIAHERAHIRRKDHFWKPLGFLILTLHWFNPVVWLGYILLCRDIELACDEKVVKELNNEQRADYSQALLTCSVNRRMIAACPLAFGEVGVKDRVKSVLNYKKPAFWIIVVAIIVSIIVAVCFLTNPVNSSIYNSRYETGKCLYSYVVSADKETKSNELVFDITSDGKVYKIFDDGTTDELGVLKESDYTAEELEAAIKNQDAKLNIGNIKNAYELSDCIFLQKSNDTVYLVQFFSDGSIMSVFKLNRIGKSDIPSFSNAEKLTWTYQPMFSFTGHSFKAISFDFDYTHVEATCTGGEFCSLDVDGQPYGSKMHFEKDNTVYWTPKEAVIEKIPQKSELTLEIYNNKTQVHKCIIVFECVSRDIAKAEFEIYFKDSEGLKMIYDNGIKLVEQGSVSNIGGADSMLDVAFESTLTYAGVPQDSNKIFYSSLNREKLAISSVRHLPIHRLDTYEDLEQFKATFSGDLTLDKGYDEVPSFNAATTKYDKDFFEYNSLMVVYIDATNSTHRYAMQSVEHSGVFCVHIEETTKAEAVDDALAGWFVIVTASDEMLDGCTGFDADFNNTIDLYDGSQIPNLMVICNDVWAETVKGTTEWTFDNGDGTMQTINGDSAAHPTDRLDYLLPKALKVKRTDGELTPVTMVFDTKPDKIEVNSWFIAKNGSLKPFDTEKKGMDIFLNSSKETCVYEVVATWNSSDKYYGTVRYSFCVAEQEEKNEEIALIPMIMVDGVLYLDTGIYSTPSFTNRTYDGKITSTVKASEKPTQNNQSNFETGLGYVIGSLDGTIEVHMNDMWRIFATEDVREKLQFPDNN